MPEFPEMQRNAVDLSLTDIIKRGNPSSDAYYREVVTASERLT